jgi:LPS-assembly lipoprotein
MSPPPDTHRPRAARIHPRLLLLAGLAVTLAACGFHLRGSYRLPEALYPLLIDAPSGSTVAEELRTSLRRVDASLTSDRDEARTRLVVLDESRDRRVLSVGDSANVDEYELRQQVRWKLVDATTKDRTPLLSEVQLEARRDYTFDAASVLSKQEEEQALYKRMSEDLAQRILFRLQSWSPGED